jgi:predicted ATPase/anti-anti-sigma regulatory factor
MHRLGSYTLIEPLGDLRYRGTRDDDGAAVIVELAPAAAGERLRRAHAILAALDHPGLARPLGLERVDDGALLVLADAPGQPLRRLGPLDLADRLAIAAALARALAAVHAAGVLHGGVTLDNLLVDPGGDAPAVTLLGFATALRLGPDGAADRDDLAPPPLSHLAPEHVDRLGLAVGPPADLYALGVTLHELLTGAPPFAADDPHELVRAHLSAAPPPAAGVPDAVADLLLRLLAKAPADRPASAGHVEAALTVCLAELRAAGEVRPRAARRDDARLYGRERELAVLQAAALRAAAGARELVLIEGGSGAGKSSLVDALVPALAGAGIHLAAGKCDQQRRDAPFASLSAALRGLLARIADGREDARARLQGELLAALGDHAQALVELVPELELVIGPQPPAPELGAGEVQNRLAAVFGAAIAVLAAPEHPLVLFLDDLQWVDPDTLWLLQGLIADSAARGLLVVGAARMNEVPDGHPLRAAIAELHARGAPITTIVLGPLGRPEVRRLAADVLGVAEDRADEVADVLLERSGGNPFFAHRLLRALQEAHAVVPGADGRLALHPERLAAAAYRGDVDDLLQRELADLPPAARELLALAAAVGTTFDRELLARLAGASEAAVEAALAAPLRRRHIVRDRAGAWRFVHDRVQQAAAALGDDPTRRARALAVGRLLLARADAGGGDEPLFAAADRLNDGAALLTDPGERRAVARVDLRAGRRARARAAVAAAVGYARAGLARLAGDVEDRELALALHAELAEYELAAGDAAAALERLGPAAALARTPLERVRLAAVRVGAHALRSEFAAALAAGVEPLAEFGVRLLLPADADDARLAEILARARADLDAHPIADRLGAPDMRSPEAQALERLLIALSVPAYFLDAACFGAVIMAWVDLVRVHGHTALSAMGYVSYGFFLTGAAPWQHEAYRLGELALALVERSGDRSHLCKVVETFAGNIAFLHEPLRAVLQRFPPALRAGLQSGDLAHAAFICDHVLMLRFGIGDPLAEVRAQAIESLPLTRRTRDVFSETIMKLAVQVADNLTGATPDRRTLGADAREAADTEAQVTGIGNLEALHRTLRLQVLVVHDLQADALAAAEAAEARSRFAVGQFFLTDLVFLAALARLRAGVGRDVVDQHLARLAGWAAGCPDNFLGKHLLVRAELAAADGDELAAMQRYDEAIAACRAHELVRDEALACERAAWFHRARGRARIARAYAEDARAAYLAWGAGAKVEDLDRVWPSRPAPAPAHPGGILAQLDAAAVIRAAQAIAGELVPARVIDQLLRIVAQAAGAERGHLVVERDGRWIVRARIGERGVDTDLEQPLDDADDLAAGVVRHVVRTRAPVVLADAARDPVFGLDPYVARRRPKSLLCLGFTGRGAALRGAVVLENNALRGAFGRDRLGPLGLLLAQAAIAMEIAELYAQVSAAGDALRRSNLDLAQEVARQTERLREELAARLAAERERAAAVDELVRAQEERIAELSAPLLPLSDDVLLLPLIGAVDPARVRRITETAVEGAVRWRARHVILDITGVKAADHEVAAGLVATGAALRLLGAETILSGIQPATALALVALDVDLRHVVTVPSLQAALAHALRAARRRADRRA